MMTKKKNILNKQKHTLFGQLVCQADSINWEIVFLLECTDATQTELHNFYEFHHTKKMKDKILCDTLAQHKRKAYRVDVCVCVRMSDANSK